MNCKVEWDKVFLWENFGTSWVIGKYHAHCNNIIIEREKAKLPEIMLEIPRLQEKERLIKLARQYRKEIKSRQTEINEKADKRFGEDQLNNNQRQLKFEEVHRSIRVINESLDEKKGSNVIPRLLCPCPVNGCRGIVRFDDLCCIICNGKICKGCREPLEQYQSIDATDLSNALHILICDAFALENLKLIEYESKACPECAIPINKKNGCDQMWCHHCKVIFIWNKGKIETGPIHNPHVVRWYRTNGNALPSDLQDVPCGELIDMNSITKIPNECTEKISKIHRVVAECEEKIRKHRTIEEFKDIHRKYLLGKISEARWRSQILIRESHNERKREVSLIIVMFRDLAVERFRDLQEKMSEASSEKDFDVSIHLQKFFEEMERLRVFTNSTFVDNLCLGGFTNYPLQIIEDWSWGFFREREIIQRPQTTRK